MKISYVTMQFPVPSETFASLDVNALISQGHEVFIHCLRFKHVDYKSMMASRNHSEEYVDHISLMSVFNALGFILLNPLKTFNLVFWILRCCSGHPKHLIKSFLLLPSILSVFSTIKKQRPDIVHLFWGHYPSMVGHMVKKYLPGTVVSQFLGAHDLMSAYPGSVALSRDADLLFTHSKANIPFIASLGIDSSKINVVLRGTRLDYSSDLSSGKFDSLESPRLITACRLIEEKGVDDVLKIFKGIKKIKPGATLYIAGDGPFRLKLEVLAKKLSVLSSVVFMGHVNQQKLLEQMSASHMFLLMSRYPSERLPNVVKEAMFQECVVITTNTTGIEELISHLKDGFIVDKGDYSTALKYAETCFSDHSKIRALSEKARKKIESDFDVNKSMARYALLWEEQLARFKED